MKTGGWRVWAALTICAAMMLGAMTWLTRHVARSERERAVAEARADLQERVRLALWRMDAAGTAIIVEENQRPANGSDASASSVDLAKMRFEISESGALSASEGESHLPELKRVLRANHPGENPFPAVGQWLREGKNAWEAKKEAPSDAPPATGKNSYREGAEQEFNSQKERAVRSKAVDNQLNVAQAQAPAAIAAKVAAKKMQPPPAAADKAAPSDALAPASAQEPETPRRILLEIGPMRPAWVGDELFLLRKVVWDGSAPAAGKSIQGVWLKADRLKRLLLAEVRDLLPDGRLIPAKNSPDGMVLASFPWRLETGEQAMPAPLPRPIVVSLAVGWIAALLAIFAVAVLVRGILRLSERRASFVSAVTHELRTPLTTFRLYSEMLETGAVKEEKRGDYLRVLSREADRLSHLVENVLAFSQIERGSARAVVRETTARELLEPMRERFAARLSSAGLDYEPDLSGEAAARPLKVDAAAVEHILFNLIDNAAKYAVPGDPPKVALGVENRPGGIAIVVRDFGPGIAAGERKRIFRAFHKSAREAAESRPGVGLGLALSRRLARAMGGELVFEAPAAGRGACFILRVPLGT
jgi:signal transduction histidine kinase